MASTEDGEVDRLNGGAGDDDAEADDEDENNTKMSIERLSLMVQFNMRGSMTSLDGLRSAAGGTSASRTDLRGSRPSMEYALSAIFINHLFSSCYVLLFPTTLYKRAFFFVFVF